MVIKYLPCRVVDRIIHFNFITYLLQAYETRPININFWWRMKGNGGYWPKVLMVQKPKWLDWCLSRTFWEPCSVAMPWIFRKPSNREGLFVILVRCQVDLGLEISPPNPNKPGLQPAFEPFQTFSDFVQSWIPTRLLTHSFVQHTLINYIPYTKIC